MLDHTSTPKPKRDSAVKALQHIHNWTKANAEAITTSQEVPSDLPCTCCGSPHDWDHLLICSKCEQGFHTYCIGLNSVPKGDIWYCTSCTPAPSAKPTKTPGTDLLPTSDGTPSPGLSPFSQDALKPFDFAEDGHPDTNAVTDLWQTAAEDEEAEEVEMDSTPPTLREIWEDKATITFLKDNQVDVELLPNDPEDLRRAMKRINKRADAFYWDSKVGKLFKKATCRYPQDREVPHPQQRDSLIDEMHADLGHVGTNKLCSVLLARYYWRGIYAHVKRRIQQCNNCLRTKVLFKQQPELRPLPQSQIWQRVAMDSMGPYPPTKRNNRYILIAVDACSKYVEARPVPELTSAAMAQFFLEDVVARHGVPNLCCTDNGKEFQKDFKSQLEALGVAHNYSGAYHPQSNGQAEAAVKATLHGLQKTVGQNPFCWDEKLPLVLLGLRNSKHATTGYSPFYILSGRHPVLPVDRRLASPEGLSTAAPIPTLDNVAPPAAAATPSAAAAASPAALPTPAAAAAAGSGSNDSQGLDPGTAMLLQQRQAVQTEITDTLRTNVQRAQNKQKKDYLKRHHSCTDPEDSMPVGSLVLLNTPATSKMHRCKAIEGPYRVVKFMEGKTKAIVQEAGGKTWPVATSRLTAYSMQ